MISRPDFEKKQILFLFTSDGDKLSFSNDNVIIKDLDGKVKHQSTCYRLFMICVVGNISITSGLIQRAERFGFSICLMTRAMKIYQIIGHVMEGNIVLHRKQYDYHGNELGEFILRNKLINQKEAIRKLRIKTQNASNTIGKIDGYISELNGSSGLQSMLGIEGSAARIYFKEIFSSANWNGRQPRIKRDYINSTLDIGYTILFNIVDAMLRMYDFDTYQGVLHTCFYMRKSLVCDLMEPLRYMVDYQVRKSINYGQIKEDDFKEYNGRFVLQWKYSPKYTQLLLEPLIKRKDDIFTYIQSYYRCFMKGRSTSMYQMFEVK